MASYEHIDHTGDIGIIISGASPTEIYQTAAQAYFELICEEGGIEPKEEKEIVVHGENRPEVLRKMLMEMVLWTQVEDYLFSKFEVVEEGENQLKLKCQGEPLDEDRHMVTLEIKAITYHELEFAEQEDGSWQARVIFDI